MVQGRRIAALEMEQEEELESLVREVAGEDRVRGKGGPRTILIKDESGAASSRVWKLIAFVLLGIVILFATDSIEIKTTSKGEFTGGDVEDREDVTDNPFLGEYEPVTTPEEALAHEGTGTAEDTDKVEEIINEENGVVDDPGTVDAGDPNTPETAVNSPCPTRTYDSRAKPIDSAEKERLATQHGSWTLIDEKADQRPKNDFYAAYPNRDIPRSEFPANAWQLDNDYVGKFLTEGIALADRAMEAILSEYGHGKEDEPGVDFETRSEMFDLTMYEGNLSAVKLEKSYENAGWTTKRSWANLKKRVLHSIMTQDSFIFAMGGHSAAAGHGNHFQQSYTLQVAWIMEPIFARLGVWHESRNFGNGGMGTSHHALAAGSMYGPDVSLLMWDSGMTEKGAEAHELFARQGIIGGIKVPVMWHIRPPTAPLLHDNADVDLGHLGSSMSGIPKAEILQDLDKIKWAARYMKCSNELSGECKKYRYNGTCWLERPDGFIPPTAQKPVPGGRAGWHPGDREHRIVGRQIAWILLRAIREVLTEWKEADNYEITDSAWHVTAMYENTRTKLAQLDPSTTKCQIFDGKNQTRTYYCTVPWKARTEFNPRTYPQLTNIRSIMPKEMLANLPALQGPMYLPPDVFNPYLHPPPGEVDVLNIVENGVDFQPVFDPRYTEEFYQSGSTITQVYQKPGKGIYPSFYAGHDLCDGTLDSWCNKGWTQDCMLYGHNDGRTGLFFDSLSGWLIVNVPKVKLGYILIKLETWHFNNDNPLTEGTTEADRHRNHFRNAIRHRQLKKKPEPYCDEFRFEYAIDDGDVISLKEDEFQAIRHQMERVVEIVPLVKEPDTWGEERDVQVAMRITGCKRQKVFSLTHVYWA